MFTPLGFFSSGRESGPSYKSLINSVQRDSLHEVQISFSIFFSSGNHFDCVLNMFLYVFIQLCSEAVLLTVKGSSWGKKDKLPNVKTGRKVSGGTALKRVSSLRPDEREHPSAVRYPVCAAACSCLYRT